MFGISRPLQEPAGRPFASEPAGVWCTAFLWPSQPGEDTAGHDQRDCPAWLELPLPWPGAQLPLLQVSQWVIRGMCLSISLYLHVAWVSSSLSAQCVRICSCAALASAETFPLSSDTRMPTEMKKKANRVLSVELIKIKQKCGYGTWITKGKNIHWLDMPHCEDADEINQPCLFHLFSCSTVHKTIA